MRSAKLLALVTLALVVVLGLHSKADAQRQQSASLTGHVSSDAEGPMEGVLVGAKAVGSNITTIVVSDSQGRYSFPAGRLKPNKYSLSIRAVGYDLDASSRGSIEIVANKTVAADLKLQKAQDVASQLSDAEWFLSIPGTPEQKAALKKGNCVQCHSLKYPLMSSHDADDFVKVLTRMRNHAEGASPQVPFDNPGAPSNREALMKYNAEHSIATTSTAPAGAGGGDEGANVNEATLRPLASYLASINRSQGGKWTYDFKTLPRPTGRGTKVIMTEYDLPRGEAAQPHDVIVSRDGTVYYSEFVENIIGKLNPQTGATKEFTIPPLLPNPPFQPGGLDMEFDSEGNIWFAMQRQDGAAKLDVKTGKITTWLSPAPCAGAPNGLSPQVAPEPNGKIVWVKVFCVERTDSRVFGLDQDTFKVVKVLRGLPNYYGIYANNQGDLIGLNMAGSIFTVNEETNKIATYNTPTPASGARRGQLDPLGRAWFAEYYAGNIGVFDPETKQIKEYPISVPGAEEYTDPYAAAVAKNGEVWAGGMIMDYIYRLDPTSGQVTRYLLPTVEGNVRRMWVEDPPDPKKPVTIWVGETHHGRIVRIEPLD